MNITAGFAKITIPLRADQVDFSTVLAPEPGLQPDVTLHIDASGVPLKVTFRGKNSHKSLQALVPGAFVVIQGKLGPGGEVLEVGITLQMPKLTSEPTPDVAAA